jgi:hypothetical protein
MVCECPHCRHQTSASVSPEKFGLNLQNYRTVSELVMKKRLDAHDNLYEARLDCGIVCGRDALLRGRLNAARQRSIMPPPHPAQMSQSISTFRITTTVKHLNQAISCTDRKPRACCSNWYTSL